MSFGASLTIDIFEHQAFNAREHEAAVLRKALTAAGQAFVAEVSRLDQYGDTSAVVRVEQAEEEYITSERSQFHVDRKAGPSRVSLTLSGHLQGPRQADPVASAPTVGEST